MLFFKKKYTLEDSGLLQGFTDWHCHLLPGVDDGIKSIKKSLTAIQTYMRLGVKKVWLTPHVMEDCPNHPNDLQEVFATLKAAIADRLPDCKIEFQLASEHMLDSLFNKRIVTKEVLPIASDHSLLLVETSYYSPPFSFEGKLDDVRKAGFFPLLAHPERYRYMDKKDYKQLMDSDIRLQLDLYSLLGLYDPTTKEKAEWLLEQGAYSFVGTDTHSNAQLHQALVAKELTSKQIDSLQAIIDGSIT